MGTVQVNIEVSSKSPQKMCMIRKLHAFQNCVYQNKYMLYYGFSTNILKSCYIRIACDKCLEQR